MNNIATAKTIYDPSVSGFAMPRTAAFTNFTSTGDTKSNFAEYNVSENFDKGWNFYTNGWKTGNTIYFYAFGCRDVYSSRSTGVGLTAYVSEAGYYWAAGALTTVDSRCLNTYFGYVSPKGELVRSFGCIVRSDKDN